MENKIIIDAADGMLGRIASYSAKQSLLGKEVIVVNCNEALITGRPKSVFTDYQQKRARGGSSQRGPHFPKSPERIMKRTIRGMLLYKKLRGCQAFKRILCYNSLPGEYENAKKISLKKEVKVKAVKLSKIGELL